MRLLKFNNEIVDIDEQTSIGIDVQAFDIRNPATSKVNVSNSFTIPKTDHNLKLVGFAGLVSSMDNTSYDIIVADYWCDNVHLIQSGRVRVEVEDRIECFVYAKQDFWDELKKYPYPTFVNDLFDWLELPKEGAESEKSYEDLLKDYNKSTEGIYLPLFVGNLYNHPEVVAQESDTVIILDSFAAPILAEGKELTSKGGHFCIYAKTIFQFIELNYGVNFYTAGGGISANIWDDEFISRVYTPFKDLVLNENDQGLYFSINQTLQFEPEKNLKYCDSKTVYDLINSFLMHFNVIKVQKDENVKLRRFDSIKDFSRVVDFSGNMQSQYKFKPYIDGLSQENLIKFKDIFPTGSENFNSKIIPCDNKNLDGRGDLLTIDAYQCSFIPHDNESVVPNLSNKESFKTFTWLIDSGISANTLIKSYFDSASATTAIVELNFAALYSISSEYNYYAELIQKPKYFEIKKWLRLNDVINIDFFDQYFIKELGASFLINKIKGFNPDKSTEPTTLELILSSYKLPLANIATDYYVDGLDDMFTDGEGDYFI